jgi:hypothetical protein
VTLFERILLHLSTWLTAGTGGVYIYMKYFMTSDDPFSVIHHPWQPHALALHLLVAPALIFALGLITREHVIGRLLDYRSPRARASGGLIVILAVPMISTGYLMQILTDPGARRGLAWAHIVTGVLFTVLFLAHLVSSPPLRRTLQEGGEAAARAIGRTAGTLLLRLDWFGKRGLRWSDRLWRGGTVTGPGRRRA